MLMFVIGIHYMIGGRLSPAFSYAIQVLCGEQQWFINTESDEIVRPKIKTFWLFALLWNVVDDLVILKKSTIPQSKVNK